MDDKTSNDAPETATLTLAEALLLLRLHLAAETAIGASASAELDMAHMALDRVIAVCAESGLEPS